MPCKVVLRPLCGFSQAHPLAGMSGFEVAVTLPQMLLWKWSSSHGTPSGASLPKIFLGDLITYRDGVGIKPKHPFSTLRCSSCISISSPLPTPGAHPNAGQSSGSLVPVFQRDWSGSWVAAVPPCMATTGLSRV